jgi:hypothetical protein
MSPWRQSRLILAEIVDLVGTFSEHGMPHLAQLRGQPLLRSQRPLFGVSSFSRFLLVVK